LSAELLGFDCCDCGCFAIFRFAISVFANFYLCKQLIDDSAQNALLPLGNQIQNFSISIIKNVTLHKQIFLINAF